LLDLILERNVSAAAAHNNLGTGTYNELLQLYKTSRPDIPQPSLVNKGEGQPNNAIDLRR